MTSEPSAEATSDAEQAAEISDLEEPLAVEQEADLYPSVWHWWHFLLLLALLAPVLAPLFKAIGVSPFVSVANFIYHLGAFISPSSNTAIPLFGYPMAVCPLCYSALIAITVCALSYPAPARLWEYWQSALWYLQLGIILLLIIPWLACFRLQPTANLPAWQLLMLLIGFFGGTGIALLGQMLSELVAPPDTPIEA
jgi:uncharacterized membrane protein